MYVYVYTVFVEHFFGQITSFSFLFYLNSWSVIRYRSAFAIDSSTPTLTGNLNEHPIDCVLKCFCEIKMYSTEQ
jgi:hypothetical protein